MRLRKTKVILLHRYRAIRAVLIQCLLLISVVLPAHGGDGRVTFIHMGDIHGNLMPRPNMRMGEDSHGQQVGGLAYLYDQIKKIRAKHPNSLLVNTGDTIHGSAEVLFSRGQAIVDVLNDFNIDAFAPGNWDYMYGTDRFIELFSGTAPIANWRGVAANLYYATLYEFPATPYAAKAGQRVLPPYVIYQVGDVKVALLGLTADRGPKALSTRVMEGFYLTTGQDELKDALPLLRQKEKVDLVVLISERGLSNNLALAERFPGIDIVLSSDMHEQTHQLIKGPNGTLLVEVGQDGALLGELTVDVQSGRVKDWQWQAHQISEKNNVPDPIVAAKIAKIRQPFIKGPRFIPHVNPINGAVLRTPIDTVIGHTRQALHRANVSNQQPAGVIEGTSHQFISEAFRQACNADVGIMRGFRYGTHISPGPVRLEDIYHFMPVGSQVACGLISGDDLRLHIERSAQGVLTQWVGAWGGGWLLTLAGVTYSLDPANEFGLRASNIRVNGELIDLQRMYKVAGYWYVDEPSRINMFPATKIRVLKDSTASIIDATDVVAYYLQTLPSHTVNPFVSGVKLLNPLPAMLYDNHEIQPLNGVTRPEY